jgi:hypothetical protein
MNGKDSLGYYLKGALAGKNIDSPAKVGECRECYKGIDSELAVYVSAPQLVTVGDEVNVCVRINNFLNQSSTGRVVLQGEDLDRGATYDFQSNFCLKQGCAGSCITFRWRAPRHAALVKWSATVHFDEKMGVGLPDCTGTTTVSLPLH